MPLYGVYRPFETTSRKKLVVSHVLCIFFGAAVFIVALIVLFEIKVGDCCMSCFWLEWRNRAHRDFEYSEWVAHFMRHIWLSWYVDSRRRFGWQLQRRTVQIAKRMKHSDITHATRGCWRCNQWRPDFLDFAVTKIRSKWITDDHGRTYRRAEPSCSFLRIIVYATLKSLNHMSRSRIKDSKWGTQRDKKLHLDISKNSVFASQKSNLLWARNWSTPDSCGRKIRCPARRESFIKVDAWSVMKKQHLLRKQWWECESHNQQQCFDSLWATRWMTVERPNATTTELSPIYDWMSLNGAGVFLTNIALHIMLSGSDLELHNQLEIFNLQSIEYRWIHLHVAVCFEFV